MVFLCPKVLLKSGKRSCAKCIRFYVSYATQLHGFTVINQGLSLFSVAQIVGEHNQKYQGISDYFLYLLVRYLRRWRSRFTFSIRSCVGPSEVSHVLRRIVYHHELMTFSLAPGLSTYPCLEPSSTSACSSGSAIRTH